MMRAVYTLQTQETLFTPYTPTETHVPVPAKHIASSTKPNKPIPARKRRRIITHSKLIVDSIFSTNLNNKPILY